VGLEEGDDAEEGGEGAGRDEVVAAGVADAGEGVVLDVEDNEAAARAVGGFEGGGETVGVGLYWDGLGLEQGDDAVVGEVFGVAELGGGVDLGMLG
jgi:hypothetical protein